MPEIPKLPPIAEMPLSVVLLARGDVSGVADWLAYLDQTRPGAYEAILAGDFPADAAPAGVRVVRPERPGEGHALRAGLAAATMPLILYAPCDPEYRPEMIASLLGRTVRFDDGVVGQEIDHVHLMTAFRAGVPMPGWVSALGWLWWLMCLVLFAYTPRACPGWLGGRRRTGGLLARALFGLRTRDVACPLRLLRREILGRIPIQSAGPFAHVELLAKANFLGCLIGDEIPVDVRPPAYRGDAGAYLADGRKVFDKPDFGPAR